MVKGEGTLDQRIVGDYVYICYLMGSMNRTPTIFCMSPDTTPLTLPSPHWVERFTFCIFPSAKLQTMVF
jgi:hypothetical protein